VGNFIPAATALIAALTASAAPQPSAPAPLESIAQSIGALGEDVEPGTAEGSAALQQPDDANDPNLSTLPPPPASPDVFGTRALVAPDPRMATRWRHVRDEGHDSSQLTALAARAARLTPSRQLGFVHAIVNRTLAYRPDSDWWGEVDYWATADQTLRRKGGDCEDLAIVKLQLLRKLGFGERDLYLMVGRDIDRGDHALLLVRLDGQYWVLDDRMRRPVEGATYRNFTPMLTFAANTSFVHGRERYNKSG
jgi:predicted transglutaminase-like cysteine proteinase